MVIALDVVPAAMVIFPFQCIIYHCRMCPVTVKFTVTSLLESQINQPTNLLGNRLNPDELVVLKSTIGGSSSVIGV